MLKLLAESKPLQEMMNTAVEQLEQSNQIGWISLGLALLVIVTLSAKVAIIAAAMWRQATQSESVRLAGDAFRSTPLKALLLGAALSILAFLVVLIMAEVKLGLFALALLIWLIARYALLGLGALYVNLGERFVEPRVHSPGVIDWRPCLIGGVIVEAITLLPFIGILIALWVSFMAMGLGWLARGETRRQRKLERAAAKRASENSSTSAEGSAA